MKLHHQTLPCVGLVLLFAVSGCGNNASTTPQAQTSPLTTKTPTTTKEIPTATPKENEKEKPTEPMKVTAAEITKAFADDKKAAEKKYKRGMILEITGVIDAIHPITDTNESGHIALEGHVKGNHDKGLTPFTIGCGFGTDKESPSNKKLASLKVGQTVTIRGVFDTFFDDWGRLQGDCVLIDPKP